MARGASAKKKPRLEPQDHGGALQRGQRKITAKPALSVLQPHEVRIPQLHGGALAGGGTPGHDGSKGGRPSKEFLKRCADVSMDDMLWQAAAKKHPLGLLDLSAGYAHGRPAQDIIGAQVETPDGFKFTLVLGERSADG